MTWLSINPDSEPRSSVELVAKCFGVEPKYVGAKMMAYCYNKFIDPTLCPLSTSDRLLVCEVESVEDKKERLRQSLEWELDQLDTLFVGALVSGEWDELDEFISEFKPDPCVW